ncbi:MAG: Phosphoglycerate kinase [Candidatus Magasanikbacteria bacterium]|nr:Phosphoglycerate kinase [Candidatus Magasanikbacteria bacterium]
MRTLQQLKSLRGQRVIVRCDFDIAVSGEHILREEAWRLDKAVPTLNWLASKGAIVYAIGHRGRPGGKKSAELSLKPVAAYLSRQCRCAVPFFETIAEAVKTKLAPGTIGVLENLRFYNGEEKNDPRFVAELAKLGKIFVNDAFATSHRTHASTVGLAKKLPAYAGLQLLKEVGVLEHVVKSATPPLVAVIGGIKMETKLPVIEHLLPHADSILLGGGIASTVLAAQGYKVGASPVQKEFLAFAKKIAGEENIIMPVDVVVGGIGKSRSYRVEPIRAGHKEICQKNEAIKDIGPGTVVLYSEYIRQARTIIWNGPMGEFEREPFNHGTISLARVIAVKSKGPAYGVVGGGETVQALQQSGLIHLMDHVSTGGGAMLEMLAGKKLSAVEVLRAKKVKK